MAQRRHRAREREMDCGDRPPPRRGGEGERVLVVPVQVETDAIRKHPQHLSGVVRTDGFHQESGPDDDRHGFPNPDLDGPDRVPRNAPPGLHSSKEDEDGERKGNENPEPDHVAEVLTDGGVPEDGRLLQGIPPIAATDLRGGSRTSRSPALPRSHRSRAQYRRPAGSRWWTN